MFFSEAQLLVAVVKVYSQFELKGRKPRCIDYFIYEDQRKSLADAIYAELSKTDKKVFPQDEERYLKMWDNVGKSARQYKIMVEVGELRGWVCWLKDRNNIVCSEIMTLDRMLPGYRGGLYTVANGQICCSAHNSHRREKLIEEVVNGN